MAESEKVFEAQHLVESIDVREYNDPKIPRLKDRAVEVLDDLAVELSALEDEE